MDEIPRAGEAAPNFELPSTHGTVRLSDLTATGKVILAFYTEDGTPSCSSEISLFKGDYDIVQELGAEVAAVSADSLDSHRQFAERMNGIPFPLVSDEGLEATRAYGVLSDDGKRSRRAVFVIEKGGTILHVENWFQPGNPRQYQDIFAALGLES